MDPEVWFLLMFLISCTVISVCIRICSKHNSSVNHNDRSVTFEPHPPINLSVHNKHNYDHGPYLAATLNPHLTAQSNHLGHSGHTYPNGLSTGNYAQTDDWDGDSSEEDGGPGDSGRGFGGGGHCGGGDSGGGFGGGGNCGGGFGGRGDSGGGFGGGGHCGGGFGGGRGCDDDD